MLTSAKPLETNEIHWFPAPYLPVRGNYKTRNLGFCFFLRNKKKTNKESIIRIMNRLLILFFLLCTMDCFSQISSSTVDFSPSFIDGSHLSIAKENSKYSMTIIHNGISEKGILADSLLTNLQLIFVEYFKQKCTLDSIKKIEELEMAKNGVHIVELDGIGVEGVLLDNYNKRSFSFRTPQRGSNDQMLISTLFKLMFNTFNNPETINYLEQLKGYFPFGVGLKELSESPFRNGWYYRQLKSMNEPILYDKTNKNLRVFRYTNLGTFSNPFSIRVELIDSVVIFNYKLTDGKGGYAIGKLIKDFQEKMLISDWNKLFAKVESIHFWDMHTFRSFDPNGVINDGTECIFEGLIGDKYHFVTRNTPDRYGDKEFASLCNFMNGFLLSIDKKL